MWRSACSAAALWSSWSKSLIWKLARPPHMRLKQLRTGWQKLPGKPALPAHSFAGMACAWRACRPDPCMHDNYKNT